MAIIHNGIRVLAIACWLGLFGCILWYLIPHSTFNGKWLKHSSPKMDVSFDYPEGWEVLFDSMDIHADVVLCPPEKERIETRYRFANCLTFIAGDELLGPPNPFEGDNAVYSYFTEDVKNSSGKNYNDFRVWRSSSSKPDAILVGLYRDGLNDKLGIWQALCAKDKLPECSDIFRHVLHSLHFEH